MAYVYAICENLKCGLFFAQKGVYSGDGVVEFEGIKVGPCPRCGGWGRVPDGIYTFINDAIAYAEPLAKELPLRELKKLQKEIKNLGNAVGKIEESIDKLPLTLQSALKTAPKGMSLDAKIQIILAIIAIAISVHQGYFKKDQASEDFIKYLKEGNTQLRKENDSIKREMSQRDINKPFKAPLNNPCPCGSGKKFKRCHGKKK